jgi:hypothetical protein
MLSIAQTIYRQMTGCMMNNGIGLRVEGKGYDGLLRN